MGMTMTQKILAKHAGLDHVVPGQLVEAKLDLVLGNDITAPVAITEFDKAGLTQVFEAVLENKPFIMNVYRCVSREKMENYLYKLTYHLIAGVVEEKCKGKNVTQEDKQFIANFYKYGFVGIMLEWIQDGMKEDINELVGKISLTLHGTITTSIENFAI